MEKSAVRLVGRARAVAGAPYINGTRARNPRIRARKILGAILKTVIEEEKISLKKLYKVLERFEEGRVKKILEQLLKEKFLQKEKDIIFIK
jgi:formate dehydrogenase maturation protein FdhE